MKLLRVITTMSPAYGGPCQGIRNSVPELEKLGVKNEVVCLDDPHSEFIIKDKFKIFAIGKSQGPWAYHKELLPWLLKNLSNYDAVIVHGLWQYHGYAVNKAANKLKSVGANCPKVFVMPHGMLDPYFQRAEGRKLKALRNILYWKLIESKLVNQADGVLFTCEAELLLARVPFLPYKPKKELNIGYGIQGPPLFTPEMSDDFYNVCPQVKNKPYLLFLSRIHQKKGVELLIQTYLKIQKEISYLPDLVIAGPGLETSYGHHIQKLARSCKTIHFPGMLTGKAKWGAFYGCNAFVLPSHQENFGIAVVEALACSKPVLISDQVNIWKEIEHENGGFVAPDSINGMLSLMQKWLNTSDSDKALMGENAFSAYQKNFAIAEAALKMKRVLSFI